MADVPSKGKSVEDWRKAAFHFASTDQVGNLISRAFSLMETAMKDGSKTKNVEYLLQSFEMEQKMWKESSDRKDTRIHNLLNDFCTGIGITIESLQGDRIKQHKEDEADLMDDEESEDPDRESSCGSENESEAGSGEYADKKVAARRQKLPQPALVAAGAAKSEAKQPKSSLARKLFKNSRMRCLLCKKSFKQGRSLTKHLKVMHGKTPEEAGIPIHCKECELVFDSKTELSQHRAMRHKSAALAAAAATNKFECEECGSRYKDKKSLGRHKLLHSSERVVCKICNAGLKYAAELKFHMRTKHGADLYECEFCDEKFNKFDEFKAHRATHNDGEELTDAAKSSTRTIVLTKGATSRDNRVMRCNLCTRGYYKVKSFVTHYEREHKMKPKEAGLAFRCDCGHVSNSGTHQLCAIANFTLIRMSDGKPVVEDDGPAAAEASAATLSATDPTAKPNRAGFTTGKKCDNCDRTFTNLQAFKKHNDTMCGTGCKECGISFKSETALLQHKKLQHAADPAAAAEIAARQFVCCVCEARFKTESVLNQHMRVTHADGRQSFTCEKCGRRFIGETMFNHHMRKEHGEKTYRCEICAKPFDYLNDVRSHMRNEHPKEEKAAKKERAKKYTCIRCDKIFTKRDHLEVHEKTCGTRCDICNMEFKSLQARKQHKIMKHSVIFSTVKDAETLMSYKFVCEVCDARFETEGKLDVHSAIHNSERFSCHKCTSHFPNEAQLAAHKRRVHGEKAYSCGLCGEKYDKLCELRTHKCDDE